jgi:hypothetical protein
METKSVRLKNGYGFTLQIGKGVSHLIIDDYNLYSDTDSRSKESWRRDGLLVPINDIEDLKQIEELWKEK